MGQHTAGATNLSFFMRRTGIRQIIGARLARMRLAARFALLAGLLMTASSGLAGLASAGQTTFWPAAAKIASSPELVSTKPPCRCVYKGRRYSQGDMVCIKIPGSSERSARCGLMLNNTSWITTPGACTPVS